MARQFADLIRVWSDTPDKVQKRFIIAHMLADWEPENEIPYASNCGTRVVQGTGLLPKPIRSGVDCARMAGEIILFSR